MTLKDLGDIVTLNSGSAFKNRKFSYKRFDPSSVFKPLDEIKLSYSTIHTFEECMIKFVMNKFLDLGLFKTSEALFLGNTVHKFIENLINEYQTGNLSFDNYNDIAKSNYESIKNIFDKSQYSTPEKFIEKIFMYVMGRKKFEPDVFFDDISFISSIPNKRNNYVETKKVFFQNAAKLMRQLFGIASQINVKKFYSENWIGFPLNDLPFKFVGKIDLYFPYDYNDNHYIGVVDFKTGKKEYFNWDQMNYYALSFGEEQFPFVEKFFFDIKEGERIRYDKVIEYQSVYNHLYSICSRINDIYELYCNVREELQDKYSKKINGILRKANHEEIHKIPCELFMMVFDFMVKEFFKAKNIADYHSNGGFACQFCDISSFCSIRT